MAVEHGVVVVDLHDLNAKLAKKAVRAVTGLGPPEMGAVVFVVGRGRHSRTPGGVLGKVVRSELGQVVREAGRGLVRMSGPARVVWITDRSKAPSAVIGGGGSGFTLLLLAIAVAFGFAVGRQLGLW